MKSKIMQKTQGFKYLETSVHFNNCWFEPPQPEESDWPGLAPSTQWCSGPLPFNADSYFLGTEKILKGLGMVSLPQPAAPVFLTNTVKERAQFHRASLAAARVPQLSSSIRGRFPHTPLSLHLYLSYSIRWRKSSFLASSL